MSPPMTIHAKDAYEVHAIFFFFWPHHVECRILVPQPRIEPMPTKLRAQCLNHWTVKEVPPCSILFFLFFIFFAFKIFIEAQLT